MNNEIVVNSIREFNRKYTNIIGLMNQYVLGSEFSLHELRILYEIHSHEKCTSKDLKNLIEIDGGYLSRILKELENLDLIGRQSVEDDKRYSYFYLTPLGEQIFAEEEKVCNSYMGNLIHHLSISEKSSLLDSMNKILNQLELGSTKEKRLSEINIRETLNPGDLGYLTYLHGKIYYEECGYDIGFEGYVCKTFYDFSLDYSEEKDRIFLAERNGVIVGSIAIVGHSKEEAQLRWYLITPEYRGIGLGKKIYEKAMNYCTKKGYNKLWLVTTDDQKKAISMYEASGFKAISKTPIKMGNKDFVEIRYEMNIQE